MVFKLRNQNTKQATPVPPGEHSVGREDFNYVHVNEPSVSRRHARLINSNEGIFVEDLGSANGTAVRGNYITSMTRVTYGDMIYFGQVAFAVEPEVPGEKHDLPVPGLKNPNPKRTQFRHDTEKLPVGHIEFEDSAPAPPPEDDLDADKLAVEIHEPAAVTAPVAAAAPVAQPKATPRQASTPAPVATPAPAPASTPAAGPLPVPTPQVTRQDQEDRAAAAAAAAQPNITVVNFNTALSLALLAGIGIGLFLGYMLAKILGG